MAKTTRKNTSNVEALNRSDVSNIELFNSQPTFSKERFPSDAGTASYRKKKGDSAHLPLELMFDMLQDEVADLRSENVSLKVDISQLNQRITFLFSFFDLQEVNTTATTQAAGESSVCTLLDDTSTPHTKGTNTFADVITDSIVTRTGQPLTIDSSTVGGPLTTDVIYKPTTLTKPYIGQCSPRFTARCCRRRHVDVTSS